MKKIIFVLIALVGLAAASAADTFRNKDGSTLTRDTVKSTEQYIEKVSSENNVYTIKCTYDEFFANFGDADFVEIVGNYNIITFMTPLEHCKQYNTFVFGKDQITLLMYTIANK